MLKHQTKFKKTLKCFLLTSLFSWIRACLHGGGGTPGRWGNPPSRGRKINVFTCNLKTPGCCGEVPGGFCRACKEFEQRRPKFISRKRRKINSRTQMYLFMKCHTLCYAVFGFARNRWLNTLYGIVWETKCGRFTSLNILKCEHFKLLVYPLRFLVIFAMRQLGNDEDLKHTCFAFELFAMNATPARRVTPPWHVYMANCHPGWQGYPTWQTGQPA